jgi:ArsR family transcriptional regulator
VNKVFKALNDKTRREILEMLRKKDMSAGEIAEKFHFAKPSISHHLDILKQANLVVSRKNGQYVIYSLNTTVFDEIIGWILRLTGKSAKSNIKIQKSK